MNILYRTLAAAALALPAAAHAEGDAPVDRFFLGYNDWNYKVAGNFDYGGSSYDLGTGFKPTHNSRAEFRLRWDTGPGWWKPDIAASLGHIEVSGQRVITTNVGVIGPIVLPVTSTAHVDTNIRDIDLTLRYPLPLPDWCRLSVGFTVQQLKGNAVVTDNAATPPQTDQPVNKTFPMLHTFFEVPIGSRLRLGAGGDWAALDGNEADNVVAIARFKVIGPLDLTGGWQRKHYKARSDSYLLDVRLQGWQLGGELAF